MKMSPFSVRLLFGLGCVSLAALALVLTSNVPHGSQVSATPLKGDATPKQPAAETNEAAPGELEATQGVPLPGAETKGEGIVKLSEDDAVWIDVNTGMVMVDGRVCLKQGVLEMFACPAGTKEHEAIVAVDAQAQIVHAGLLAVGAQAGNPVQFRPEYKPASGTEVDVYVLWADEQGNRHSVPAQHWVRKTSDGTQMDAPWVFAGSTLVQNQQTGLREYGADTGDLICVSNFPTAMLDLPIESTELDDNLLFESFTENIPAVDTPVRLVLVPRLDHAPIGGEEEAPADE